MALLYLKDMTTVGMRPDKLLAVSGGPLRFIAILSSPENAPAAQTSSFKCLNLPTPLRLRHTGKKLNR